MKNLLLFFLFIPAVFLGQTQVGQDLFEPGSFSEYGASLASNSNGNIIAIAAPFGSSNGLTQNGFVEVYENTNGSWTQIGSTISGTSDFLFFAESISLSSDGTRLAVGTSRNIEDTGLIRVFENSGGTWIQLGSDIVGSNFDGLGGFVSLSGDGTTLAAGAEFDSLSSISGFANIYTLQGDTWVQVGQTINGMTGEQLGRSLDLSNDGSRVLIGAAGANGSTTDSGIARVFENQNGSWVQIGQDIQGEFTDDSFGTSVAMSSNGTIIAISAIRFNGVNGSDTGNVQVYEEVSGVWTQIGDDIEGEVANGRIGNQIDLSDNGNILILGGEGVSANSFSGNFRVFQNISGVWTERAQIDGEDSNDVGRFLTLSGNGQFAVAKYFEGAGGGGDFVRVFNIEDVLSIDDTGRETTRFSIYPNPSNSFVTINYESSINNISIINLLGQEVRSTKNKNIDVSDLSNGVYLIQVIGGDNSIQTQKLIVEN